MAVATSRREPKRYCDAPPTLSCGLVDPEKRLVSGEKNEAFRFALRMVSMEIDAKTEVNATALASILGLTARRVQQLAQDGIITTVSKGKYNLSDAVQSYVVYREADKPLSQAENEKLNADVVIKKAKATMMALEAKEIQGKMHRSEDVADMTEDLIYTIRSMLLSLPGRLAVDAAAATDPAEVSEVVRKEIYSVMEELSKYKYDAKKYEERVRKRQNWEKFDSEDFGDEDG